MATVTTYINEANWEHFKDEASKSGIINQLLSEHYSSSSQVAKTAVAITKGYKELTYTKVGEQDPWDRPHSSPEVFRIDDSKMTTRVVGVR